MKLRLYLTDDPDEEPRIIEQETAPTELILPVEDQLFGYITEIWELRRLFVPSATNTRDEKYADYRLKELQ